jgi:hypothetical protein
VLAVRLIESTRGAAMVAGVFMACFAVGALYHLVIVGQSIAYRTRMQQAADDDAFDAAVGYARSMNEIALSNNVQMVAVTNVFALEVAVGYLEDCAPGDFYTGGTGQCSEWLPRITAIRDRAEPSLVTLITTTGTAAEQLRDATPELVANEIAVEQRDLRWSGRSGVAVLGPPMALGSSAVTSVQCARAGPLVLPLLESSILPPELVQRFSVPLQVPISPMPLCPWLALRGVSQVATDVSGSEAFQIRTFVVGPRRTWIASERSNGVGLILRIWAPDADLDDPDFRMEARESVARTAIAQAEYYSDWEYANLLTSGSPMPSPFPGVMAEEDAYYMHWRARLRRVRVPVDADPSALDAGMQAWSSDALFPNCLSLCESIGDCGAMCDTLTRFRTAGGHVLH